MFGNFDKFFEFNYIVNIFYDYLVFTFFEIFYNNGLISSIQKGCLKNLFFFFLFHLITILKQYYFMLRNS